MKSAINIKETICADLPEAHVIAHYNGSIMPWFACAALLASIISFVLVFICTLYNALLFPFLLGMSMILPGILIWFMSSLKDNKKLRLIYKAPYFEKFKSTCKIMIDTDAVDRRYIASSYWLCWLQLNYPYKTKEDIHTIVNEEKSAVESEVSKYQDYKNLASIELEDIDSSISAKLNSA